MDDNGVTISFKEIYDEVRNMSTELSNVASRLEKVEKKLDKQEDRKVSFTQKIVVGAIIAFIPIGWGILLYIYNGGAA